MMFVNSRFTHFQDLPKARLAHGGMKVLEYANLPTPPSAARARARESLIDGCFYAFFAILFCFGWAHLGLAHTLAAWIAPAALLGAPCVWSLCIRESRAFAAGMLLMTAALIAIWAGAVYR